MKQQLKIQTNLRSINIISAKFAVASVSFGTKVDEVWENVYLDMHFYNEASQGLQENILYNITGKLSVKPKYNNIPAKLILSVATVERATPQDPNYKDPVSEVVPAPTNIPM